MAGKGVSPSHHSGKGTEEIGMESSSVATGEGEGNTGRGKGEGNRPLLKRQKER